MSLIDTLIEKARKSPKRVALPEVEAENTLLAARCILDDGIAFPVLVGDPAVIAETASKAGVNIAGMEIVDITDEAKREEIAARYMSYPKLMLSEKGAKRKMKNPLFYAMILEAVGDVDATFCGYVNTTGDVLVTAQQCIGMADGVDSLAHKSALAEGQKSYGVLGCGVDICYPKKNMTVYEELQKEGGVLSEFPPGTVPQPQFFPIRNRIISGMSDVVLVMEAREKSGSLITARWALEQGRDVFALPGRICDKTSDGCHRIIAEGAGILCSPEGLLADLKDLKNWDYMPILSNPTPKFHLEKEEALVYSCLDFNSKSIDELQKESGLSMTELLPAIYHLCDRKLIEESFIHQYVKL